MFNDVAVFAVNAKSFVVHDRRLVKRSEALWGHNLTRDSRVDGASMTCSGASENFSDAQFVLPQLVRLNQ